MIIWTLTIDTDDGVSTEVFWTEPEALSELRKQLRSHNGDEVNDLIDEDLIDYATEEQGWVLYLDEHTLDDPELCGDWPAPCNCEDPTTHTGRH